MQWDRLKIFYHVARHGSFTKTAQELNVAQSSISRQIINLEDRLGHVLFKRLPRGLALTKHGELLFQYVEKMFVCSELALTQLHNEQSEPQGELKVGSNVGLVDTWLCDLLPDFLKLYPKINLSLCSKDSALDVESLEVHVALQPHVPDQPDLVQNLLMKWRRKLYASKEYIAKHGAPESIEEIHKHRLIGFGTETIHLFDNINWHLRSGENSNQVIRPYVNANSIRTLFHFGNSGLGIISFSQESPLLQGSNLVEILPELMGPSYDIYFSYPMQLQGIKKIEVLYEFLKQHVDQHHKKVNLKH